MYGLLITRNVVAPNMDLPETIASLTGRGVLRSATGDFTLDGDFEVVQGFLSRRMLVVNFIPTDPTRLDLPFATDMKFLLEGKTNDSHLVKTSSLWPSLTQIGKEARVELQADWVATGVNEESSATEFTFQIPNFEFTGAEWSEYSLPDGELRCQLDKFQLTLSPRSLGAPLRIQFQQVHEYDNILSELRRTSGNAITATLRIAADDGRPVQCSSVAKFADDLLWLTAFGVGRAVPWLGYEATIEGSTVRCFRRWVFLNPYRSPYGCIDTKHLNDLRNFLQTTSPRFEDLLNQHRGSLIEAIAGYVMALQFPPFPTPIYLVARAFEALIQALLTRTERDYPLADIDQVREELKAAILETVKSRLPRGEEITEEFCKSVQGKVNDVLRRSLKRLIQELLKKHGVPYDSGRVRDFVNERHGAVHWNEMKDFSKMYDAWLGGTNLLERLILKLLNYQGMYFDRTKKRGEHQKVQVPWV